MIQRSGLALCAVMLAVGVAEAQSPSPPPPWAYTVNPPPVPGAKPTPPAPAPQQVPGSTASLTVAQTRDAFNPPDWHPSAHPPMPESVSHGRRPEMRACGFCHLVNGQGRPENASLAGLPAAYFASFPFKKWIRVVEAADVPKTRIAGSIHTPTGEGTEPLGQRIVEMPEDLRRTELRDAASGFVAYVPKDSVAKGESLVKTGGVGKTVACGTCHGPDLKGLGPVPPLAGRSPSYTVRQLFDLQQGVRKGPWSALMKSAVEKLTVDDMVAIAAYTASREP